MTKRAQLLGKRFGHLVVIGLVEEGTKRDWHCQCDCGKVVLKKTKMLTVNKHLTCGDRKNCRYLQALTFGGNRLPVRKRLSELMTTEELHLLVKQPCEYCGQIYYNGIGEGPSSTAIVCICKRCRVLRMQMSHFELLNQVKRIAKHQGWGEAE